MIGLVRGETAFRFMSIANRLEHRMESFLQNVRIGFRSLRRTPGFAAITILTLALGIGLSTAVFTVADALLLRRLPVRDQDQLVLVAGQTPDGRIDDFPLGVDDALAFARRTRSLARVAFFTHEGAAPQTLDDGGRVARIRRSLVSGDFFDVLGARPVLGRALRPEDDVAGAAPVVVLSHRAWQDDFGGASDVIGRTIRTHDDGVTSTVVGVMPRGLDFPRGTDAWAAVLAVAPERTRPFLALNAIGRLAPGATPANARDEMTAFFGREGAPAWQRDVRGTVRLFPDLVVGATRPAVLAFAAASALLLLITCVDVATLLLVRGFARAREFAVRTALGAGRARLVAQLLVENVLLAAAGGVLGAVVAALAVRAFVAIAPAGTPRLDEIRVDATSLAGAAVITTIALLIFALAPAVLTSRSDVQQTLGSGTRQSAGRRSRVAIEGLVAGQIALALLVLSAAALIGRSLVRLERADLSFEPSHLLVAELGLRADRYDSAPKQAAMLEQLVPALQAVPGVRGVTPVVAAPFAGASGWDGHFAAEGQPERDVAANPVLNMELVGPMYFATLGVPLLRGRAFTDDDRAGSTPVVILSRSAARRFWPDEDAIGRRVTMGSSSHRRTFAVVGIVPETRWRDLRDARPSIYFPLRQSFFPFAPTTLAIRASGEPSELMPALRRTIAETAPGVALARVAPFDELLAEPLAQPRLNALLLAVFAAAAVTLAAVGLFGVMATMVRQRRRELGVRMALGATARDVARLVMRRGMMLAAIGTATGLAGALAADRLLAALLYDVSPTDVPTLALAATLLLAVAAIASGFPARSSTRIEPVIALRAE